MKLEIGVWGLALRKKFEMVPSETSANTLIQGEMNVLVFIIRGHTEKENLALLNYQDLEFKKKVLEQILLSTVACMYTGASRG